MARHPTRITLVSASIQAQTSFFALRKRFVDMKTSGALAWTPSSNLDCVPSFGGCKLHSIYSTRQPDQVSNRLLAESFSSNSIMNFRIRLPYFLIAQTPASWRRLVCLPFMAARDE